jgi:hypothetical protein
MTFAVTNWPAPDDLDRYAEELGIGREVVVRDIVRLVSLAHMVQEGELNEDWVLTGGMAMRLRGSPRFTVTDTDTSRRGGWPERERLSEALTIDQTELTVTPVDYLNWRTGNDVLHATPVNYEAYFAALGADPVEGEFKFTVSWRGLEEPAQHIRLRHPYAELQMTPTDVPLMDLTEQAAEKIVGWCVHKLVKHYSDVAWIFWRLRDEIIDEKLGELVVNKLETGRKQFPAAYERFPDLASVIPPLLEPDDHDPPIGDLEDDGRRHIQFISTGVTTHLDHQTNKKIVRDIVVPILEGAAEAAS